MVTVFINGDAVQSAQEKTVLELARKAGYEIPTLCYHPALAPFGACRLCVVEIKKGEKVRLDTACTYPLEEGLYIQTDTPAVKELRRMVVELLLARCPGVKTIDKIARELGVKEKRLPLKGNEHNKCVLCGRCVRVCREVIGKSAVSFAYRGIERKVASPFQAHARDCVGCTACAFVCPTGAISVEKGAGEKEVFLSPWKTTLPLIACPTCGQLIIAQKAIEHIKERNDLAAGTVKTTGTHLLCPQCRRKETVKKWPSFILSSSRVSVTSSSDQ